MTTPYDKPRTTVPKLNTITFVKRHKESCIVIVKLARPDVSVRARTAYDYYVLRYSRKQGTFKTMGGENGGRFLADNVRQFCRPMTAKQASYVFDYFTGNDAMAEQIAGLKRALRTAAIELASAHSYVDDLLKMSCVEHAPVRLGDPFEFEGKAASCGFYLPQELLDILPSTGKSAFVKEALTFYVRHHPAVSLIVPERLLCVEKDKEFSNFSDKTIDTDELYQDTVPTEQSTPGAP